MKTRHLSIFLVLVVGWAGAVLGTGDTPRHPDELVLPDQYLQV